ncbi:hypothetical protein [Macrococcoides canis]|uniref:hypothetical protein n=1 Tax=Macrococcoides canis TaxID=1855823 RepID=UPI001061D592|nr:hypothetical protein [Macrococcus canis]TDM23685.1 hypothetical protein ETI02_04605 [Macrococcus canis]TDM31578.1 hypothetical protein ETI03_04465 [Macrococcus canis]TDM34986.1 hypothetical protein ETI13_04155 [Macrococcus canis]TDM43061.1 hypothetical protein ETI09_01455 [Macrococcus canis]
MSDIIIFPKLEDNLRRQIRQAMKSSRYEDAYDLFITFEKHFELNADDQLLKLECLYQLESFLELKEESSILLNQGHPAYNEIIPYFLESLMYYKQYQTVVELIEMLRQENVDQKLLMTLMPLYDEAAQALETKRHVSRKFIMTFQSSDSDAQCDLILRLIDEEDFAYQMSFLHILESNTLHPKVISFILQYLRMAQCDKTVTITKFDHTMQIEISQLNRVETSEFQEVVYGVYFYIQREMPSAADHAFAFMKQHHLLLYPLEFEYFDKQQIDLIIQTYAHYILQLFTDIKSDDLGKQHTIDIISKIDQLEKYNQ